MNARFTPEQARALRRRREHERQTVIFGVLIAALAVAGLTGVNLGKLIKTNMPFLIIMIILAFLFAFIPQITLVIPDLIYG